MDTFHRHWVMLRCIPRAPRKIDGARVQAHLEGQGFRIDRRSIQRDLQRLSGIFPLVCDERSKPFGWSWARDASAMELPGLDPHTALTLAMVADHLDGVLPPATLEHLAPFFDRAKNVLSEHATSGLARWQRRVRVLPEGQPMAPALIEPAILNSVYQALLDGRQLNVTYRPKGASDVTEAIVHPLGLVVRSRVIYLVATFWSYQNVRQLAVHRLELAASTEMPADSPKDFDLDAYIESGAFGFLVSDDGPVRFTAEVSGWVMETLAETPLANDQVLTRLESGEWRLEATIPITQQFWGWILSYGSGIRVLEPLDLRRDIAEEVGRMAVAYE